MGRRNNILGINERNIKFVYPSENRKYFKIADEKSTAKQLFLKAGVPHPKTLWECREFKDIVNLRKSYADYENTVIKPNKGRGGHGILVLDKSNHLGVHDIDQNLMTHKHIRKHLADIIMGIYSFGNSDKAIFENRLFPDSFLKNIYARGLADFRFIIYKKNPVMAMLRIPTEHSHGKANLHQGGIGVGIDMEKGVTTHAIYKCPFPA
jgi:alpha-L-glutamate ligase-like protein